MNFKNCSFCRGTGDDRLEHVIGAGEWLMGPGLSALMGPRSSGSQPLPSSCRSFSTWNVARYVMYTERLVFPGYMRCRPGPKFLGLDLVCFSISPRGVAGWAGGSAATLSPDSSGASPEPRIKASSWPLPISVLALVVLALLFGGTVQKGLERVSTFIVLWIAFFLLLFNLIFVDGATWWRVFKGFFAFGQIPQGVDILLLGAFAAYSGAGGIGNIATASWCRDKGYGMGSVVGAIPSAVGGKAIKLSKIGTIFDTSKASNMTGWKNWWIVPLVGSGSGFLAGGASSVCTSVS